MVTKQCFKCKRVRNISCFYKHKKMADGYLNKCKECNKKDVQLNYRKNIDYYKEYDLKRNKTFKRKAQQLKYMQRKRAKSPGKYKANGKVNNAVRDGRLEKKSCRICGNKNSEAHHKDYRKYLEVDWLCRKHHKELHIALNKIKNLTRLKK